MKIALIGTRGVPANYGGFETCVEEIGKRLSERGHHVSVYCRKGYYDNHDVTYRGMQRIILPNIKRKSLDTIFHTSLSIIHSLCHKYDIYMIFNAANSTCAVPLRIFGKKIVINPDGLEWKRAKWGILGQTFYKFSEVVTCLIANRIVSDSHGIREHYLNNYKTESSEIAYGAYIQNKNNSDKILSAMGLEEGKYFLQITRFEPENNPLLTIEAFKELQSNFKLVLVGGTPYSSLYNEKIQKEANQQILLPGFIYDRKILQALWCNCLAYIHGNSVGGTNPALLQAMASGSTVIASNIHFNKDVLSDCGIFYDLNIKSLKEKMFWVINNPSKKGEFKEKTQCRIREYYSWEIITDKYEHLFKKINNKKYPWKFKWILLLKLPALIKKLSIRKPF